MHSHYNTFYTAVPIRVQHWGRWFKIFVNFRALLAFRPNFRLKICKNLKYWGGGDIYPPSPPASAPPPLGGLKVEFETYLFYWIGLWDHVYSGTNYVERSFSAFDIQTAATFNSLLTSGFVTRVPWRLWKCVPWAWQGQLTRQEEYKMTIIYTLLINGNKIAPMVCKCCSRWIMRHSVAFLTLQSK